MVVCSDFFPLNEVSHLHLDSGTVLVLAALVLLIPKPVGFGDVCWKQYAAGLSHACLGGEGISLRTIFDGRV
jgi:hypothetical protein